MNLYQQMKAALGLPDDAPDEEVAKAVMGSITATAQASKMLAEQQKQIDALMQMPKVGVVSVTDPGDEDDDGDSKQATVKSKAPNFGDAYSPDVFMEMQQQIVDLQARLSAKELESAKAKLDALIDRGQREGKLVTPKQIAWARSISVSQSNGRQVIDTSNLETFLANAPAINALVGSQSGGVGFDDDSGLSPNLAEIAKRAGVSAEAVKQQMKQNRGAN
jgi:hypothetical protein